MTIVEELSKSSRGGKVGAVGFCWGGAFVNRLAVSAGDKLDAGVVYYGPAPDPSEASKVQAPLLIHHAGLDARVAATLFPWVNALRAANKPVTYQGYDGANHAFNNDTSAERYSKEAADLAWDRTIRFFKQSSGLKKRAGGLLLRPFLAEPLGGTLHACRRWPGCYSRLPMKLSRNWNMLMKSR